MRSAWFLTITLVVTGLPARPAIVSFDAFPDNSSPILTAASVDGFDFASEHFHIVGVPNSCCVSNGTKYLGLDAPSLGFPVTMTKTGGGTFDVTGLDGAKLFLTVGGLAGFPNAITLDLLGNLSGGGTISTSLVLPPEGTFSPFVIGGFTSLTSLVISGSAPGTANASWGVDNIIVDETVVPEPSTFGLMIISGAAMCALARRRRPVVRSASGLDDRRS